MASSDDINIRIKVDTSDVPKAEQQVSTFEKMVEQAVSRMKQALSLKVDTAGLKEAMGAVKSLNSSMSSVKPNIKLAADTSGIQPAVSAVKNLESSAAKPVTVKTAANTAGIQPAVSAVKSLQSSAEKPVTVKTEANTSGIKTAVSAVKNLESSAAKPVTIKTEARTSGIQSAMSAVNNLKSAASKPVTVKTAVSGDASSVISEIKSKLASIPRSKTTVVSANDGGSISALSSGFQTLGAKAKSAADGVMNIGTLARSSLPSVNSAASSSAKALGSVGSAASDIKSKIADIGESASSASDNAGKLHKSLLSITGIQLTGLNVDISDVGRALGSIIKDSYNLLSTSEQVAGGVEALYGDAADSVKKNAKDAFETAGLSANRYMDIATSLGAVMTNSVGGDAKEAARLMDMAIRDMSDNANMMGTDMESIIETYQSLSRGNYEMLDNLKLGYGGTKKELKRLIDDTNKYRDANNQLSADKFSDIAIAIHETQKRLHILGTTQDESAKTLEGSFNKMKAAWEIWKTDLGKGDIGQIQLDTGQLVDSFKTWIKLATPKVFEIIKGLVKAIPSAFDDLKSLLPKKLQDAFSPLSDAGKYLKPSIDSLGSSLKKSFDSLKEPFDKVKKSSDDLMESLGNLVKSALPSLKSGIDNITPGLSSLVEFIGKVFLGSLDAILKILKNITDKVGEISGDTTIQDKLGSIAGNIDDFVKSVEPVLSAFYGLIKGAYDELVNTILPDLQEKFGGFLDLIDKITGAMSNISESVAPPLTDAINGIKKAVDDFKADVGPLLQALGNFIYAAYDEFVNHIVPELENSIKNLSNDIDGVIKSISGLLEAFRPYFKGFIDFVSSYINEVLVPAIHIIGPIVGGVVNLIGAILDWFLKTLKNRIDYVSALLRGDWNGAWKAASQEVSDSMETIKKIITDSIEVGKELVKGIWKGVLNQSAWLAKQLRQWSLDVVKHVKVVFQIGSPSKVFAREVGRFIPQGIAVGIDADTGSVLDSLRSVKTKALDEVSGMRMMSTYTSYTPSNTDSYSKVPTYTITGNPGYSMPLPSNKSQSDSPYQSGQPVILQVNLNGKTIAKETYKDITYLQKRDTSRGM